MSEKWAGVRAEAVRLSRWLQYGAIGMMCALAVGVFAQLEGGDRGVAPIDSTSSYEVSGIMIDETADNAEDARMAGWREAQRKGWQMLWQKMHGTAGPVLSDDALDSMIEAVVVEDEQISEHRYIARLGILFDRVRSSQVLGISGTIVRSPPLLVIPVMWDAGTAQVFETRTPWQTAWAHFRAGSSPISYVRPSGTGPDPLLINAGLVDRRGRNWWRMLLDQYGAADVIIPQVRLQRSYPGGPITGHFTARYGPENRILGAFDLKVNKSDDLQKLMDVGVQRMDALYTSALNSGQLRPDPSLIIEAPIAPEDLGNIAAAESPLANSSADLANIAANANPQEAQPQSFTVQFVTPDAGAISAIETRVRAISGVKSASTNSVAIGGTSVMSVSFAGDLGALRAALEVQGFHVEQGGGALRISRPGGGATPAPKHESSPATAGLSGAPIPPQ